MRHGLDNNASTSAENYGVLESSWPKFEIKQSTLPLNNLVTSLSFVILLFYTNDVSQQDRADRCRSMQIDADRRSSVRCYVTSRAPPVPCSSTPRGPARRSAWTRPGTARWDDGGAASCTSQPRTGILEVVHVPCWYHQTVFSRNFMTFRNFASADILYYFNIIL